MANTKSPITGIGQRIHQHPPSAAAYKEARSQKCASLPLRLPWTRETPANALTRSAVDGKISLGKKSHEQSLNSTPNSEIILWKSDDGLGEATTSAKLQNRSMRSMSMPFLRSTS